MTSLNRTIQEIMFEDAKRKAEAIQEAKAQLIPLDEADTLAAIPAGYVDRHSPLSNDHVVAVPGRTGSFHVFHVHSDGRVNIRSLGTKGSKSKNYTATRDQIMPVGHVSKQQDGSYHAVRYTGRYGENEVVGKHDTHGAALDSIHNHFEKTMADHKTKKAKEGKESLDDIARRTARVSHGSHR